MLMAIPSAPLKLQTGFAGRVGERHDAPVVDVPVAIEHDLVDALGLEALRDGGADLLGLVALLQARQRRQQRLVERRGGGDRLVRVVVHDLRVDVLRRTEHSQTRAIGRAVHLLADAVLAPLALLLLSLRHCRVPYAAPVLPTLRLIVSSTYLMPLPLYGSGGRMARIFDAVSPSSSLSMPDRMTTFLSTLPATPLGRSNTTGCENPSAMFSFCPATSAR